MSHGNGNEARFGNVKRLRNRTTLDDTACPSKLEERSGGIVTVRRLTIFNIYLLKSTLTGSLATSSPSSNRSRFLKPSDWANILVGKVWTAMFISRTLAL